MARANDKEGHGWDFIELGETYQYKEDSLIAMVKIIEDTSNDEYYTFKVRVEKANVDASKYWDKGEFTVSHIKKLDGYYSGMSQFYEDEEYALNYSWTREDGDLTKARTPHVKGVKVTKLKEREDAYYPGNIDEGYVRQGDFVGEPVVGQPFWVGHWWRTSEVKEILSENTFKTWNSIYKWEMLEEQN